jgi:type I restriction-modification system DNA methylase subunit
MNLELARKIISETFKQAFDEGRFQYFIRNLLNHSDESKKQTWTLKKAAFEDYVNHFTRLGTYTDPRGERLDVLVIHLRKDTTLARGRVTLRNFVADYLATGHGQGKAAVIAAFVSPSEEDWRFSFVKLDYTLEKTELGIVTERAQLTPARRYSYLVGKNENCHTAQKQFIELLQTDTADPALAQLETAFSVEKVTKEFYDQYKDLFEKTRDALKDVLKAQPSIASHFDERGIENDDFAKKLLGQIVFLYFLQKKGWFGVEPRKAWGTGRKDFIRHLFRERATFTSLLAKKTKRATNFFNDILEPLFYEALAIDRSDNGDHYSLFDCKIPFLNGGLFEPIYGYQWQTTDILLPDMLFSNDEPTGEGEEKGTGILDVFDRYNFTVNEAEPLEKEVAVDPEMLGKVFENLLPENIRHASGTYYTPRVIVHYMCQQALLHYLAARAPQVPQNDLALFLRHAERFADFEAKDKKSYAERGLLLPESISQNAAPLDDLLATITVCDPAIGSGAFPVGMMHEIVRARIALTPALEKSGDIRAQKPRSAYALKRDAIHHSLYGVDLDPGAVEIAKLRLWLSMVVDEEEIGHIQPLPNLDYKIMQGNSLLEEFDGIRLLDEKLLQPPDTAHDSEIAEIKARIATKSQQLFALEAGQGISARRKAERQAVNQEVNRLKKQLAALVNPAEAKSGAQGELNQQTSWASLKRIQELHARFFDEDSRAEKERLRRELDALEWKFMEATLREQGREEAIAELKRASAKHRKPFFLWRLHFAEIFQNRGGFDVVIANPPWVRQEEIKELKPALKRNFKCFTGTADLYVYFYERAVRLLDNAGSLAFISSNAFLNSGYGEKLREFLKADLKLKLLLDFAETKVFDAVTEPCILIGSKADSSENVIGVKWDENVALEALGEVIAKQGVQIKQKSLARDSWRLLNEADELLLSKLRARGTPLSKLLDGPIYSGIKPGHTKAFIVSDDTRACIIGRDKAAAILFRPMLRGRDVSRWTVTRSDEWLIQIESSTNKAHPWSEMPAAEAEKVFAKTYPGIFEHFQPYRSELIKRTDKGIYYWEMRACAYWHIFRQPKLVYQEINRTDAFAFDVDGFVPNNKIFAIPNAPLFLLAIFNSAVGSYFIHTYSGVPKGGFLALQTPIINEVPIPPADAAQKASIERLVEYLLWLHREVLPQAELAGSAGATLLAGYFEQWVNSLVYELFFPEPLHAAGLHFFHLAEQAKLPALSEIKGRELSALRATFEELYAPNHPLRQGLFALDSIEEIRIIEGKA